MLFPKNLHFSPLFLSILPTFLVSEPGKQRNLFFFPIETPPRNREMASSFSLSSLFTYSLSQVPIFEGVHYDYRSTQMEKLFISQDLWDIIEEGFQEVDLSCSSEEEGRDFKESKKKNAAALTYIQQGVSRSIFF